MAAETDVLRLSGHPRAVRGVARAKAWGALGGFLLGGYLSLPTHTVVDAGLRALATGALGYLAMWGAALFLWRHLVVVELRNAQRQLLDAELSRLRGGVHPREPTPPDERGRTRAGA